MEQALAVRPYDGGVQFKAGEEAALAGDLERALKHWKQAFHAGPEIQAQLIDYFARRGFPLAFYLEHFQPDRAACHVLEQRYRPITSAAELRPFLQHYARAAAKEAEAAEGRHSALLWLDAYRLAAELNDHTQAWRCAQQALAADEGDLHVRLTVGQYLLAQKRYDEAEPHLKWCLARRPGEKHYQTLLEQAAKGRIDAQTQAAAKGPTRQ
jgi:predicted Zn-dependent protease